MRSQRQLQVGEEVRHALASVLMRGDVPWPSDLPEPVVTVTEVQISPDLKNATVFVIPLGGLHLKEIVRAMNDRVGFYRHEVAQTVKLRHVPKIRFEADNSFAYAERIETILHQPKVAKDLQSTNPIKK
jgi:ribosome-binding factor A